MSSGQQQLITAEQEQPQHQVKHAPAAGSTSSLAAARDTVRGRATTRGLAFTSIRCMAGWANRVAERNANMMSGGSVAVE